GWGRERERIQEGSQELVQSCVGELHLGLDTGQPHDMATGRVGCEVVEQRCLADPGLAANDEHLTVSRACAGDHGVEGPALTAPAVQRSDTVPPKTHTSSRQKTERRPATRLFLSSLDLVHIESHCPPDRYVIRAGRPAGRGPASLGASARRAPAQSRSELSTTG